MAEKTGSGPLLVQNVTAVNGFAYGALGADIHVNEHGLPAYLLAQWKPEQAADPDWLRELPSRMLNARRAVVPFTGRNAELEKLRDWRDTGGRLSVQWLHGPGGQGKSRLADQFAKESASLGWQVIVAFHGPDADPIESGSQDLRAEGAAGVLIIVDYADRWLLTNLSWLFKNRILHKSGTATRILLIARTDTTWLAVRNILEPYQADAFSQALPPLKSASTERADMFTAARDGFAAIYESADAGRIPAPESLEAEEFGLVLAVHMAALVAVADYGSGENPPSDMAGLTMYLLNREQLQWWRLYQEATASSTVRNAYSTRPEVMNQAVFAAVLTGTMPRAQGVEILEKLYVSGPGQVLNDHSICYPPAAPHADGSTVLEPLYPDRLAEDFLALTVPGHGADYPEQPWSPVALTSLMAPADQQQSLATWIPRAVTFLTSAAVRWPHLRTSYLYSFLLDHPGLALAGGNAAMTALAGLTPCPVNVLEAVEGRLPPGRDVNLDPGIAAVVRRLADYRLAASDDPAERARIYSDLATRLTNAGLRQDALAASEQMVLLWQDLASTDREAYLPDLAGSLADHALRLAEVGQRAEALRVSGQALALYRELAGRDRAVYLRGMARSVNNHALRLAATGNRTEALALSAEAVELRQELVGINRGAHLDDLATSLNNHAIRLADAGHREQAVPVSEQAVTLYTELADLNRGVHLPDLAMALTNHTGLLAELGEFPAALDTSRQAVDLYEKLTGLNRDAYLPDLTVALNNHAALLALSGQPAEAIPVAEQGVILRRELTEINREAYLVDLAISLANFANQLAESGNHAKALEVSDESIALHEELIEGDRAAYLPAWAAALANHSMRLAEAGRTVEAIRVAEQAVALYEDLISADREGYLINYAHSVFGLGYALTINGNFAEAVNPLVKSLELSKELPEYARQAVADAPRILATAYQAAPREVAKRYRQVTGHSLPEWIREHPIETGPE